MEDSPTVRSHMYCVTCKKSIPLENLEALEERLQHLGETLKSRKCPVCGTPLVIKEEPIEPKIKD